MQADAQAGTSTDRRAAMSAAQARGFRAIVLLAVLTLIEYFIAVGIDSTPVVVALLAAVALVKAWVILVTFMHISRLWRGEGSHE